MKKTGRPQTHYAVKSLARQLKLVDRHSSASETSPILRLQIEHGVPRCHETERSKLIGLSRAEMCKEINLMLLLS